MTILLIMLAAAALFAAMHRMTAPLLDDEWERHLPARVEDLELLLSAEEGCGEDDTGWTLWRPDFNQKKISF